MPVLSKENFEELARFNNNLCISIFLPTERAGHEVLNEKSKIQLKSRWKEVYEKLKDQGLRQDEIDQLGEPVEKLLDDRNFWRHQSEGLALFISKDFFRSYTLPVDFVEMSYVSDHFYLKPLVPLFSGDARFYLLSLQPDKVRFFEATRYRCEPIDIEDKVPAQLEDRVGHDFEERGTKRKTQNSRMGSFTQHGYAPASKDERNEILRFFRAVDKGLDDILHDQRVPLVLACQDYLYPIYEEATSYQHLYPDHVSGNPTADYPDDKQLHQKAVEVLEPFFNKDKDEKLAAFQELGPERVSSSVSEIIPALYEGKVDTLFLQNREDIWGKYNEKMASVEVNPEQQNGDVSLMNLAAVKAIEQQGKVFLVDRQFMPTQESKICAVYRY